MASKETAQCLCGDYVDIGDLEDHVAGCNYATNFQRTTDPDGAMFYLFADPNEREQLTKISVDISYLRSQGFSTHISCSECSFKAEVGPDDENIDECPLCQSELIFMPDGEEMHISLENYSNEEDSLGDLFSPGSGALEGLLLTESGRRIIEVDLSEESS